MIGTVLGPHIDEEQSYKYSIQVVYIHSIDVTQLEGKRRIENRFLVKNDDDVRSATQLLTICYHNIIYYHNNQANYLLVEINFYHEVVTNILATRQSPVVYVPRRRKEVCECAGKVVI